MTKLIAILTGVGGHFLNGRRLKGYGYSAALIALPLVVLVFQVVALIYVGDASLKPALFAGVFLVSLVSLWAVSAIGAIRDHQRQHVGKARVSLVEIFVVTTIVYGVVLYGVLTFVVVPNLRPGERIDLFGWSSTKDTSQPARLMPAESGDVVLRGIVFTGDNVLPNAEVVLLFQGGFRSAKITASPSGEFEYRLPVGEWRLLVPMVMGQRSKSIYVTFRPDMLEPIFSVGAGPAKTNVDMKIVVER